tara:strand:+ start:228 stop:1022 length:795 start_codon:yes stop_codon:yes gene_type:complete
MKKFTSSFSTKSIPGPNDVIVSINDNKEILFNKESKQFLQNNINVTGSAIKILNTDTNDVYLTNEIDELSDNQIYLSKREIYPFLDETSLTIISRSFQIYDWAFKQKFCSRHGTVLSEINDDLSKSCPDCSRDLFPKMSPCILVSVTFKNKILLVRHNNEIRNLSTVIAGFVELGETLEECVIREVYEEVGLRIKDIKYVSSQSWPFPNQLMVAFKAESEHDELTLDNNEILDASWYSKDELPTIPPEPSLSNFLIRETVNSLI